MPPQANTRSYGTIHISTEIVKANELIEDEQGSWMRRIYPSGFRRELKSLAVIAIPAVLTQLLQYLTGPIALMFCGHLGETELAAVSLALTFTNVAGITIANGMATACDTLFSQVYGSKTKTHMGVILQRSLIILCLSVVPCWAIHLNLEALLRILGQEPAVARIAGQYMLIFMPGALAFFIYICVLKFLQNQNIVIPNLIIGVLANGINALLHYLLLFVWDMGIEGSAIALDVTYLSFLILTLLYIFISKIYKSTWNGWSWECLQDWAEFLRLALSGLVMMIIEHCAFETGVILAGLLGQDYLGAMALILQLASTAYVIPQGMGIAASIRVGQYLGAGDSISAKTIARVTLTSTCFLALIVATVFITLRNYLPLMFTNVPSVIQIASGVMPLCGIFQLSDALAGTGGGILRGQGRQRIGAWMNIIAYTLGLGVAVPLLLLTDLKLQGFFGGLALGVSSSGIVFVYSILKTDWQKEALEAELRTRVFVIETNIEDSYLSTTTTDCEKQVLLIKGIKGTEEGLSLRSKDLSSAKDFKTSGLSLKSLLLRRGFAGFAVFLVFILGLIVRFTYTNYLTLPLGADWSIGNFTLSD